MPVDRPLLLKPINLPHLVHFMTTLAETALCENLCRIQDIGAGYILPLLSLLLLPVWCISCSNLEGKKEEVEEGEEDECQR